MLGRTRFLAVLLAISGIAAGVAACGDRDDDSGDTTMTAGSEAGSTVSVESLGDAGEVLVDEHGAAPTSDDSLVEGKLGTIDRPDGTRQVTSTASRCTASSRTGRAL